VIGCLFFMWLWNSVSVLRQEHRLWTFHNNNNKSEMTGWRKPYNKQIHHNSCSSPTIRWTNKSRRWAEHTDLYEKW
jgi:hypothetical protein